jgi:DNA-binding transcriptional LysR family regulator
MDKLASMNAYVKVVTHGSYAEAARQLGLTRSAVSKAVMEIEQLLGVRLLDRTTRRVSATEAGLVYFEQCMDILSRIEEAELNVSRLHDEPRGILKVNAPVSFGVRHLGTAVADFMAAYPEVSIELILNDRFIDPLEEGIDVTVRIGELAASSMIARKLATAKRVIIASPDYLARHGEPQDASELINHRCLTYGHSTTLQRWQLAQAGKPVMVPVTSVLCSNNGDILRAAAVAGRGIATLPTFIVGPDIKAGQLMPILPQFNPTALGIHTLYAPHRYLAAKARVFIDFLANRFSANIAPWDDF